MYVCESKVRINWWRHVVTKFIKYLRGCLTQNHQVSPGGNLNSTFSPINQKRCCWLLCTQVDERQEQPSGLAFIPYRYLLTRTVVNFSIK